MLPGVVVLGIAVVDQGVLSELQLVAGIVQHLDDYATVVPNLVVLRVLANHLGQIVQFRIQISL